MEGSSACGRLPYAASPRRLFVPFSEGGARGGAGRTGLTPAAAALRRPCRPSPPRSSSSSSRSRRRGARAMASQSPFVALFGETLTRGGADVPTAAALEGKTVGIYFSAHWCPPCVPVAAPRGALRRGAAARVHRYGALIAHAAPRAGAAASRRSWPRCTPSWPRPGAPSRSSLCPATATRRPSASISPPCLGLRCRSPTAPARPRCRRASRWRASPRWCCWTPRAR